MANGHSYESPSPSPKRTGVISLGNCVWGKENSQTFQRMLWMKGLTSCLEQYHGHANEYRVGYRWNPGRGPHTQDSFT